MSGSLTTAQEFSDYEGGTGIYRAQAVTDALLLAEAKVSEWTQTFLLPTQFTEEFPWPLDDNKIMLRYCRIQSIDSVTGLYWLDPNSCEWQEAALPCAKIFDAKQGIIQIMDRVGPYSICCGTWRACPIRIRITYTSGFTTGQADPTTPDGMLLRSAIYNAAVGFLQTSIGLNAHGDVFIPNFTIAGYSESRQLPERSGAEELINQHIQNAKNMCRKLRVYRPISIRSRAKYTNY